MLARSIYSRKEVLNAKLDYGAKGDGQYVVDGACTAASTTLTSASGLFTASDVGKTIFVREQYTAGATGSVHATTIATYVSPTEVTMAAPATYTKTGAYVVWGTDDTTAIQNALTALSTKGQKLYIPSGIYLLTSALTVTGKHNFHIYGDGRGSQLVRATGTILEIHGDGPAYTYAAQSYNGYAKGITVSDLCLDGMFMGATTGLLLNFVAFSNFERIYARNLYKIVEQQGVSRCKFSGFRTPDYSLTGIYSQMFNAYSFYSDVSVAGAVENDNTYFDMWLNGHRTFFYFVGNTTHYIDGMNVYDVRLFNWGGTWYSGQEGIHVDYGAYGNIKDVHFFGSGSHNLTLNECRNFNVSGNCFYFAGNGFLANAINITGSFSYNYGNVITGNWIEEPSKHGIYISGADNFTVDGNNIRQPSYGNAGLYDGVNIASSKNGTVDGVNLNQSNRAHRKDIATSGTCTYLNIYHPYSAHVDLTGGGTLAGGGVTVQEVDGSPSVSATTIKFPNGSLTDNGSGVVTIDMSNNYDDGYCGEPETGNLTVTDGTCGDGA